MGKKKSGKKGSRKKGSMKKKTANSSPNRQDTRQETKEDHLTPMDTTNPTNPTNPTDATTTPTRTKNTNPSASPASLTYDDYLSIVSRCKDVVEVHNILMEKVPDMAVAVAAIQALTWVVEMSTATTLMELQHNINNASETLIKNVQKQSISLRAGCDIFNRYVTRTSLDTHDFDTCKQKLVDRGKAFSNRSLICRQAISKHIGRFLRDGLTILIHGRSRVVAQALLDEAKRGKFLNVICTESRPDCAGYTTAKILTDAGIPVRIILDSAVGHVMERVDVVVFGAEGVVENGGIINKVGSYGIAVVAKALNKPVYVAAESYKFARLFPLNQKDVPQDSYVTTPAVPIDTKKIQVSSPTNDYTPPEYISLLFTDIGIFTPSAVSDELIKLYA